MDSKEIKDTIKYWEKRWDYLKTYHNCANQRKYLEKILPKKHQFSDITRFIRPLNIDGYYAKREEFKTKEIDIKKAKTLDITQLCKEFIEAEQKESAPYYSDVQYFPEAL